MPSAKTRDMGDDITNRGVFDQQAEDYDSFRPKYPTALFDTLVEKTHLKRDAKLLEIGLGTGQATLPLAQRGYTIVGVELGDHLAEIARQHLQGYDNAQIHTTTFEAVKLPEESFDLLYSATAFHWIDHKIRFIKSHQLLKPRGYLAFLQTNHTSDGQGDVFYVASQPIYDKYMPVTKSSKGLLRVEDLGPHSYEPSAHIDTKLFTLTHFECFPFTQTYSTDEYIKLIGTYSPQLTLSAVVRTAFFTELKALITNKFNGHVTKQYAMSLAIFQKV